MKRSQILSSRTSDSGGGRPAKVHELPERMTVSWNEILGVNAMASGVTLVFDRNCVVTFGVHLS